MNVNANMTKPPNPRPEARSPTAHLDLDEQILLAEQAVIVRDERIRRRTDAVVHRVKHGALKHAGGGAVIAVASLALTWWLNRRRGPAPAAAPAAGPSEGEEIAREAGLSIAGLLPLIWPMMPRQIRRSVTPGTAGTLLAFVTPLVARLFRRRPRRTA